MGTTQILGIVLGITLVSPQLLNAYAVASTAAENIPVWDFGFAQVQMIGYQAQVIPAILAGFALVYFEKFFRKITPATISMIVVPFCSLILAVLVAHTILGPIGWVVGDWISNIVWSGLTAKYNWLFAAFFGFFYAPLVITGLHHMTNAIDTQLISSFDGTILWPMIALSNIAQGSAVLAMIVLQKHNERAQQVSVPACISCYLGVTEPALFGVNLKYTFPFVCGMIGSALAAVISVGTGTMAVSIGVGGIPGILSILPQYMFYFLLAMIVAIAVPFTLTYLVGKKQLTEEDLYGEESEDIAKILSFVSPMQGRILPLSEVKDKVFSEGLMGEGYAVELDSGDIVAPFDGEIIMTFPTKHAYGIRRQDGLEVLIHIGMDTVELNGDGFECLVEQGEQVKAGQLIAKVDLNYVQEHGKSLISPVVVTSGQHIRLLQENEVICNQEILQVA